METNIHFNKERFQTLKETYRCWWDGTLDRPILPIVTNGYVQQMYRYFRLSSFTHGTPFDLVPYLRDTLVYRLVVVGENAKKTINELLV